MANELATIGELGIVPQDPSVIAEVIGGDFLPRIMLMQGTSDPVKEGKINQGHFALVADKSTFVDMSEMIDALLICWRPKAMRLEGGNIVEDVYDVKDPIYQKIKIDSQIRDGTVSAMHGPEFLCYLPAQKKFATFFFSNPTLRTEAPIPIRLTGKVVTFQKKLIKRNNRSWFGLTTFESKTPINDLPALEEMKEIVTKFQNPSSKRREEAPEAAPARAR